MDNRTVMIVGAFFSLLWVLGLFCILKPDRIVSLTAKFFKWQIRLYGFRAEIEITPQARIICRVWNVIMLLFISLLIFLIFSGRLK